jgi:hypothetical protein
MVNRPRKIICTITVVKLITYKHEKSKRPEYTRVPEARIHKHEKSQELEKYM